MIGIKLQGHDDFLDLKPDTSIQLKLESPLLGDGEKISPGSYSYPFDIPAGQESPSNAEQLKHPGLVENSEAFFKDRAELYFNGVPFRQGNLQARSYEDNKARGNFLFGLSQIRADFKDAELRDVVSETVVIDDSPILKRIFIQQRDGDDFDITVNGKAYQGTIFAVETAINNDASNALDTGNVVPYCIRHSSGTSPLGGMSAPYLEIKLVTYETVGGTPTFVDATDPLLPLHVRANDDPENYRAEAFDMDAYYDAFDSFFGGYFNGTYPDDRFRVPLTLNGAKYTDPAIEVEELVNHTIDGQGPLRNDANYGILTFDVPFRVLNKNSLQPFAMLKWILDKIGSYFGFEYEGDFYEDPKVASMLIYNSNPLDDPQLFLGDKKFIFWKRSFNMNELVPKMKVPQFFGALQSRFNIGIYYNEITRKVRLQYREPIALDREYDDITSISSPKLSVDDQRISGVRLIAPRDEKDATSVEESYIVGTPEQDLTVTAGRLHQMRFFGLGNHGRELVRVERNYREEFDLRLFSYRGIVSTPPFSHPWAHIHGVGNDLYDIQSIYEDRWQYWIHYMMRRRLVRIECAMPFRMIRHFDWELKRRYDRVNYLVKSISVKMTMRGISVADVELITMQ